MTQPTYQLDEFRFQNDSGSDASPSWAELSNTDTTLTVGSANVLLLRFQMHNTNSKGGVENWDWEYSLEGGTWTPISSATVVIRATTSAIFTDNDDCSNQLTSRAGTYVTNNNGYSTDGVGNSYTHTSDYYAETALVFYIPDTEDVADTNDIEIRIVENSGDTIDYNSLTANITVDKPEDARRIFITHV